MAFYNMKLKLNIFNNGFQSPEMEDEEEVNMVDVLIGPTIQQSCYQDPLEQCLAQFNFDIDIDESIREVNAMLDSAH